MWNISRPHAQEGLAQPFRIATFAREAVSKARPISRVTFSALAMSAFANRGVLAEDHISIPHK